MTATQPSFPYVRFLLVNLYGVEVHEDLDVALTHVPAKGEWTIRKQVVTGFVRDAAGQAGPAIAEDMAVAASLPTEPAEGYVRVTIAGRTWDAPRDVAKEAGWTAYADRLTGTWTNPYAERWVLRAMSEGLTGTAVLLRAVAIRESEHAAHVGLEEADKRLHAARVERQAAMLNCRARGLSETYPS